MTHKIVVGLVLAIIGWRIYSRVRRNIGQQPFRPARLKLYVGVFVLASAGFAVLTVGHPRLMLGWLGGAVLGVPLAIWALRLTRFETTAKGRFYTPNGHIGVALSLLFIARIAYRMIAVYAHLSQPGSPAVGQSALTFFTFELLAGYNVVYYAGVLRRCPTSPSAS